jgi:hypothetical protein
MLALVDAGFGSALVCEAATRLRFPNVEFRPVNLDPTTVARLSLVWRPENDNPALARLLHTTLALSS